MNVKGRALLSHVTLQARTAFWAESLHVDYPHSVHLGASLRASEDIFLLSVTTLGWLPPLQRYPVTHTPHAAGDMSLIHLFSTVWEAPDLHTPHARTKFKTRDDIFGFHPFLQPKPRQWSANKTVNPKLMEMCLSFQTTI